MRLTETQQRTITETVHRELGENVTIRLFGSRLDDTAKGGDVDLLIESPQPINNPAEVAARISAKLIRALGGRKVDVLLSANNLTQLPIHRIAHDQGAVL